jgi:hypothetical protein
MVIPAMTISIIFLTWHPQNPMGQCLLHLMLLVDLLLADRILETTQKEETILQDQNQKDVKTRWKKRFHYHPRLLVQESIPG